MKKLFLLFGIASFFMTACNNAPKQEAIETETEPETRVEEVHVCPMDALKENLANWENLADSAKVELISNIKAMFDEKDAAMAAGEGCCQLSEEEAAKIQALKEKWANWPEDLEAQKAMIEERFAAMSCCKHGEEAVDAPAVE